MIRNRRRWALAIVAALGLVVAGCSGSESPSSQNVSSESVDLGTPNPATGTPVKVGFITEGVTPLIDNSGIEAASQAARQYINEYLGGIKGHPVEIELCQTQGTPSGSADCANRMIDQKVPVVLGATPAAPAPIVKALGEAGIPYFINVAVDQSAVLDPNTYVLTNTLGFLATPVTVAKQKGFTKVATVLIDVPAAVGPITALGQPYYEKAGIENSIVAVPLGTPDMTPQVQTEMNKDPQMFVVVGEPSFCTSALSALHTLGFEGEVFINSQCLSPDLHDAVPGGIGGVMVGSVASQDPADPEVALYLDVMEKYAPDVEAQATATPDGFSIMLALARAMNAGLEGDMTPEAVKAAFAAAPPQPLPLFAGQTFRCDRTLFALTPAVCSSAIALITMNEDGTPGATEAVDVMPVLNS